MSTDLLSMSDSAIMPLVENLRRSALTFAELEPKFLSTERRGTQVRPNGIVSDRFDLKSKTTIGLTGTFG